MAVPFESDEGEVRIMPGGFISEVWYTNNRDWAFQRVGDSWNLYDNNGDFVFSFRSFISLTEYIKKVEE